MLTGLADPLGAICLVCHLLAETAALDVTIRCFNLKFAAAVRRKLSLLNRLSRISLSKSVHVDADIDLHKSPNL